MRMMRRYETLCVLATLVALGIGAANKLRLGSPPDAAPFLQQVRTEAAKALGNIPGFVVQRGQLPRQAFELLRPNVLESRAYTEIASGAAFTVLLVHCGDVNDMGAHYPPACYPGSGFKVTQTNPMPLELAGLSLNGVEYHLNPSRFDERSPICIWNCMFLPGGESTYSPNDLRARTRTGNLRYYGSGQIQVLVSSSLSEKQRQEIYQAAIAIYEPAIRAMLSDPRQQPEVRDRLVAHE